jgi:replicative DNA helicase
MLLNICDVQRRPAALFSMEMPAEQIVSNMLCMKNRLDTRRFRSGNLEEREWARLEKSLEEMQDVPLYIDDTPALRVLDFRARARRLVRRYGVEFIVVDYLQLMRAERQTENRAVEVGLISSGIKALAREAEVPVMAIAQLSRRVEQENRYPRMSDLRESGAIEQDADAILLLHRPTDPASQADGEGGSPAGDAENLRDGTSADLLLAKQRNGPTGMARMVFIGQYLRFEPRASQGVSP